MDENKNFNVDPDPNNFDHRWNDKLSRIFFLERGLSGVERTNELLADIRLGIVLVFIVQCIRIVTG